MIRGIDDKGAVFIGLLRGPLLERFLAGERVCIPSSVDSNGLRHPHVCLFLRDTNEQLVAATGEYWPDGFVPGAAIERLGEEPK